MRCIFYEKSSGNKSALYIEYSFMNGTFSPKQIRIINNTILFTKDNWETASLALGEISMPDGGATYGIVAEALVGRLLFGEGLYLTNSNNSITLDKNGIVVKRPKPEPEEDELIFSVNNTGNLYIKGEIHADSGKIGGLSIKDNSIESENRLFSVNNEGYLIASSGKIGGYTITDTALTSGNVGMSSDTTSGAYAFWAGNTLPAKANFSVTNDGRIRAVGGDFTGNITALSGEISAFSISNDNLKSLNNSLILDASNGAINGKTITASLIRSNSNINTPCIMNSTNTAGFNFNFKARGTEDVYVFCLCAEAADGTYDVSISTKNGVVLTETVEFTITVTYSRVEGSYDPDAGPRYYYNYLYYNTKIYKGNRNAIITGVPATNGSGGSGLGYGRYRIHSVSCNPALFTQYIQESSPAIGVHGSLIPQETGMHTIGNPDHLWKDVYQVGGGDGSDRKIKKDISALSDKMAMDLICNLTPSTYKFKDFNTPRMRAGFIAQEVEQVLLSMGLTTEDWALVNKTRPNEPDSTDNHYTLDYKGLIAPIVKVLQNIISRVETIEKTVTT